MTSLSKMVMLQMAQEGRGGSSPFGVEALLFSQPLNSSCISQNFFFERPVFDHELFGCDLSVMLNFGHS